MSSGGYAVVNSTFQGPVLWRGPSDHNMDKGYGKGTIDGLVDLHK